MNPEYHNNTINHVTYLIDKGINAVCTPIVSISIFLILILSFCWSLYFIIVMINRYNKKNTLITNDTREEVVANILENERNYRNKRFALLAICLCESAIMFSLLTLSFTRYLRERITHVTPQQHQFSYTITPFRKLSFAYSDSLFNKWTRYESTVGFNFFLSLLILVRILTQYMVSCYSFFKTNYSLSYHLIRSVIIIILLTLMGLFQFTVCLFRFVYFIYTIYEFVLFLRVSRRLRTILYKRYFDAKVHENQSVNVIGYFKTAQKEYKISSFLLSLALLGHVAAMCMVSLHQIIVIVLNHPTKTPYILFGDDLTVNYDMLPLPLILYDRFMSSLIEISFTFGIFMLVSPYIFVSMNYIVFYTKRRFHSRKYRFSYFSDPNKIQELITKHNISYNIDRN